MQRGISAAEGGRPQRRVASAHWQHTALLVLAVAASIAVPPAGCQAPAPAAEASTLYSRHSTITVAVHRLGMHACEEMLCGALYQLALLSLLWF